MDKILLELPLTLIDEDAHQPRTHFDPLSLQELAETIRVRGVKTPISVRPHPDMQGRYIINHGARRFRASLLAGKKSIPACVDNTYTEEDQLIENLQRDNLTPKEIAVFLGRLHDKGHKKGEIARTVGKSPSWVTQHLRLLMLPEPVAQAFEKGRCADVTVLYELSKIHKNYPDQLCSWLEDKQQGINRGTLNVLQAYLSSCEPVNVSLEDRQNGHRKNNENTSKNVREHSHDTKRLQHPVVHVEINGMPATLLLHKCPTAIGRAWLCGITGELLEVDLKHVCITHIDEELPCH